MQAHLNWSFKESLKNLKKMKILFSLYPFIPFKTFSRLRVDMQFVHLFLCIFTLYLMILSFFTSMIAGKGWYKYDGPRGKPVVDPEVTQLIEEHCRSLGIERRTIGSQVRAL